MVRARRPGRSVRMPGLHRLAAPPAHRRRPRAESSATRFLARAEAFRVRARKHTTPGDSRMCPPFGGIMRKLVMLTAALWIGVAQAQTLPQAQTTAPQA